MPVEATWKLEDMIESDEVWEELYAGTKEELKGYQAFKGHLGESADQVYECLKFDEECTRKTELLYVYARGYVWEGPNHVVSCLRTVGVYDTGAFGTSPGKTFPVYEFP